MEAALGTGTRAPHEEAPPPVVVDTGTSPEPKSAEEARRANAVEDAFALATTFLTLAADAFR